MDLMDFRKLDAFDIILLAVFVIYIVFQVPTPDFLVPMVESPLGLVALFAVAVSLFVYKSPILGVLFVFVAYELLRRNQHSAPQSPIMDSVKYMANRIPTEVPKSQLEKDLQLTSMNPMVEKSLEEEIISKETPLGKSNQPVYTESSFHPVADQSKLGMTVY
jgi:hypothetical protein